ncbi:hydroxyisourate hydrolase [Metabacillus rhizolycopersici]|jgi:5-hydroxyisourate hydrolase|uniref:5-hydroxyisourate hydrolase n=1 Tax=Metabacillus rhizolycopersici TaxID=2875709 RepID=A0ABS7UTJ6_9BACI|nr:hydroxyisourate hydrolase [Metabacillus rhizolycopersici]MBZ5751626.1 hydroxyisourate hydrolase [Metabacillus rhizolycopersici]
MTISLSTHVLDLNSGVPAEGVKIEFWKIDETNMYLVTKFITNQDGRITPQIIEQAGEYQLLFYIGDYFKSKTIHLSKPMFLNKVPIQFGIEISNRNYHIPLLISPWGYQTYRGS